MRTRRQRRHLIIVRQTRRGNQLSNDGDATELGGPADEKPPMTIGVDARPPSVKAPSAVSRADVKGRAGWLPAAAAASARFDDRGKAISHQMWELTQALLHALWWAVCYREA
jgi:hypothetical protein